MRGKLVIAIGATALAVPLAAAGAAGAAVSPKVGTYYGTDGVQKASIEVYKKGKRKKVRLLGIDDTCAAGFLAGPLPLGSAGGPFGGTWTGFSHTTSSSGEVQGRFSGPRRATIMVESNLVGRTLGPGDTRPPAASCSLQYTIGLRFLPNV